MKKVLLYSGGTDSWLIDKIWKPDVRLYVDLKSMYSTEEMWKIVLGKTGHVEFSDLPLGQFEDKKTAFIPMRNMYLLMQACFYGEHICLGATKEDAGGSSDKDIEFLNEAEHLLNRLWAPQSLYAGKKIIIEKQFLQYTKNDLIQKYLAQGGNINEFKNETFSCYSPKKQKECLMCKACFRKFIACYGNGADYTKEELEKIYTFAERSVVHRSHHAKGRYFLDKDNGEEVLRVLMRLYSELGKELNLD